MKTHKRTMTVVEQDNGRPDLELPARAIEDSIIIEKSYRGWLAGCLVYDENAENPIEENDGMGKFYHWKDHGREELAEYCRLRGYDPDTREKINDGDPDAVDIDKYEHSGIAYSVRGEGMNCQWDTSTAWAVWYPDKCLLDELKDLKGQARRKKCIEYARQACEEINKWFNGEVYGWIITEYDQKGEEIDQDSCWGYFGSEYATQELKDQMNYKLKGENK